MKFGQVTDTNLINFTLPEITQETINFLKASKSDGPLEIYVGYPKWNKKDLTGFYPRGTKDELTYYGTQFNAIELNATFYKSPSKQQVEIWKNKTPSDFKFFPKIPKTISHYSRLLNVQEKVIEFVDVTALFEEKLGMGFLQMIENFKPKDINRLANFLKCFPVEYPLAIEVRNYEWFLQPIFSEYNQLLLETNTTNIIVDTPGRRDVLNLTLTTPIAFIRFVAADNPIDLERLDEWIKVIKIWKENGLQTLNFFIHQTLEKGSPLLATYFIEKLNNEIGYNLHIPQSSESIISSK